MTAGLAVPPRRRCGAAGRCRRALGALALAAVTAVGASCGTGAGGAEVEGVHVVTTISIFADFAREVGGDLVTVESIVDIGGDPHTYESRPSDAIRLTDADVVLHNGLGLSPWYEQLDGNVQGIDVELTAAIAEEAVTEQDGVVDPHMWMVPRYVAEGYLPAIAEALAEADPANAEAYAANAERYAAEILALGDELAAEIATIAPERRLLVTSHDAYRYFADEFGFELVGTVIGVSTEEEPRAGEVAELVDLIRARDIPAIFLETTVNPAVIEQVAADAGARVGDPLYGDSVGEPGSGAETYEDMMRANVDALVEGLNG
ncbi:MAG: zinc ABC transporter substrate-binding protein [Actinomycetota bacterium]|nr:zinc ABC transporter substrate-binding protein [Actinomycetota bacterium]